MHLLRARRRFYDDLVRATNPSLPSFWFLPGKTFFDEPSARTGVYKPLAFRLIFSGWRYRVAFYGVPRQSAPRKFYTGFYRCGLASRWF